ncbi:hypothetical protein B0T21DRAFT_343553 [Apiosordaria backusii]|uniref:Uncharacterized protein n=1 Tax=Apiosordaria backusii TaxID=314023 RepID=A0AA40EYF9_9PEZI|nr:hypothetical protein B0T21DRAFT_343553 [Apiosordaria backusii]
MACLYHHVIGSLPNYEKALRTRLLSGPFGRRHRETEPTATFANLSGLLSSEEAHHKTGAPCRTARAPLHLARCRLLSYSEVSNRKTWIRKPSEQEHNNEGGRGDSFLYPGAGPECLAQCLWVLSGVQKIRLPVLRSEVGQGLFQGLGLDDHPFSMPQPSIRSRRHRAKKRIPSLHAAVAELSELLQRIKIVYKFKRHDRENEHRMGQPGGALFNCANIQLAKPSATAPFSSLATGRSQPPCRSRNIRVASKSTPGQSASNNFRLNFTAPPATSSLPSDSRPPQNLRT